MPKVSIGVPVYNGEAYLALALESLLGQTWTDLEVVICDNASTDGTERIACEFVARDPRVRYHRNSQNIGAAANFRRVFELSGGEYFKWAAADDICGPEFIAICVEVLDSDPGVVLAFPETAIIDERGEHIEDFPYDRPTDSDRPVERFEALLDGHRCYQVFGLIRRAALEKTQVMGAYCHGDEIVLVELALLGRFVEVPGKSFYSRRHSRQSMAMLFNATNDYSAWFNPALQGKMVFPVWRVAREMAGAIRRAELSPTVKAQCVTRLLASRWCSARWLVADLRTQGSRVARKYFPGIMQAIRPRAS